PNPFNPDTRIEYALHKPCHVNIKIYNILGQTVKILIDEYQQAGEKSIIWDGTNSKGHNVATGVYLYRLEAGDFVRSKKMLLLK
ncbi:MAG: FlgD immunoglobulin-like domain containing protein, partial [Candidatus Zixiibacteriota bacterium]